MKKNTFKKTITFFKKSETLIIQKQDDIVYLCDGHIIVKIPEWTYNEIRVNSGRFVEMTDNITMCTHNKGSIPEKTDNINIAKLFNDCVENSTKEVRKTPFLMEYDDGRKIFQRIFIGDNCYIAINNDFYEIAEEIGFAEYKGTGKSNNPICADTPYYGIEILPIVVSQDKIKELLSI